MADLSLYEVMVGRNLTTMKLTEEDAKAYGDRAKKVQPQRRHPPRLGPARRTRLAPHRRTRVTSSRWRLSTAT